VKERKNISGPLENFCRCKHLSFEKWSKLFLKLFHLNGCVDLKSLNDKQINIFIERNETESSFEHGEPLNIAESLFYENQAEILCVLFVFIIYGHCLKGTQIDFISKTFLFFKINREIHFIGK
jgi:hypothetical protein